MGRAGVLKNVHMDAIKTDRANAAFHARTAVTRRELSAARKTARTGAIQVATACARKDAQMAVIRAGKRAVTTSARTDANSTVVVLAQVTV